MVRLAAIAFGGLVLLLCVAFTLLMLAEWHTRLLPGSVPLLAVLGVLLTALAARCLWAVLWEY